LILLFGFDCGEFWRAVDCTKDGKRSRAFLTPCLLQYGASYSIFKVILTKVNKSNWQNSSLAVETYIIEGLLSYKTISLLP
jgi:hypothetical protein